MEPGMVGTAVPFSVMLVISGRARAADVASPTVARTNRNLFTHMVSAPQSNRRPTCLDSAALRIRTSQLSHYCASNTAQSFTLHVEIHVLRAAFRHGEPFRSVAKGSRHNFLLGWRRRVFHPARGLLHRGDHHHVFAGDGAATLAANTSKNESTFAISFINEWSWTLRFRGREGHRGICQWLAVESHLALDGNRTACATASAHPTPDRDQRSQPFTIVQHENHNNLSRHSRHRLYFPSPQTRSDRYRRTKSFRSHRTSSYSCHSDERCTSRTYRRDSSYRMLFPKQPGNRPCRAGCNDTNRL